jgi:hypothetical protein
MLGVDESVDVEEWESDAEDDQAESQAEEAESQIDEANEANDPDSEAEETASLTEPSHSMVCGCDFCANEPVHASVPMTCHPTQESGEANLAKDSPHSIPRPTRQQTMQVVLLDFDLTAIRFSLDIIAAKLAILCDPSNETLNGFDAVKQMLSEVGMIKTLLQDQSAKIDKVFEEEA